MTNLQQKFKCK